MPNRSLIRALLSELEKQADAARAPGMQAYMKSEMPYFGVSSKPLKELTKTIFAAHPISSEKEWTDTVLALWRKATHREVRYAALHLVGDRKYRSFRTLRMLPVYEELITTGAWWDYVDDIATHRLSELMKNYPAEMKKEMRAWAKGRDMWKRRSAILSQLPLKEETDLQFLYECIEYSIDSKELFLRKAIGWVLRDLAWRDPDEVIRYIDQNEERLSGLSKREALKNIGKSPKAPKVPKEPKHTQGE
jgi:3-methyladenine DNA glycosylase AlkD